MEILSFSYKGSINLSGLLPYMVLYCTCIHPSYFVIHQPTSLFQVAKDCKLVRLVKVQYLAVY